MSTIMLPRTERSLEQDCQGLHLAMKGFGVHGKHVINILGRRNAQHRIELVLAYRNLYGEDLLQRLKKELSGNLQKAVLLWMLDPAERDAMLIRNALKVAGTKDKTLIEMLCTRTPAQLHLIRQAYHLKFHRSLDEDIRSDTSGDYRRLLIAYGGGQRPEGSEVDMDLAKAEALELYKAGERRLGTDECTFIRIFSTRSAAQLNATFQIYEQVYRHDIEKAITRETSGNFRNALQVIAQTAQDPAKYFAKALYKSMKGIGTDDSTLIRIVVTRAEIDMQYIKGEFYNKYQKNLEQMISGDTSGDYKYFLLTLIGSV